MRRVKGTGWAAALCASFVCATGFCSGPIVQWVPPQGRQAPQKVVVPQPTRSVLQPRAATSQPTRDHRIGSSRRQTPAPAPARPTITPRAIAVKPAPHVETHPTVAPPRVAQSPTAAQSSSRVRAAAQAPKRKSVSEQAKAAALLINTYTGAQQTVASLAPTRAQTEAESSSDKITTSPQPRTESAPPTIRLEPATDRAVPSPELIVRPAEPIVQEPFTAPILPAQPDDAPPVEATDNQSQPRPLTPAVPTPAWEEEGLPPIQGPEISPQAARRRKMQSNPAVPSPLPTIPRISSVAPQELKSPAPAPVRSALLPARIQSAPRPVLRHVTPVVKEPQATPEPIPTPTPTPTPSATPNQSSQSTDKAAAPRRLRILAAGQPAEITAEKPLGANSPQPIIKVVSRPETSSPVQVPVRSAKLIRFVPPRKDSDLVQQIVGPTEDLGLAGLNDSQPIVDVVQSPASPSDIDRDDDFDLKPIGTLGLNVRPPEGELPPNHAAAKFAKKGEIVQRMGARRDWNMFRFTWEASALAHRPLYFEDPNLERYGQSHGILQPFYSAVHFFGRVPFIPYMRGAYPPLKPIYALGYYRPGSYAPYNLHLPKPSIRGATYEAAAAVGLIYLLP